MSKHGGDFHLRRGSANDLNALQDLLECYQMDTNVDPAEFLVAELDGMIIGAARLEWETGMAFIRPVIVDRCRQGEGVGRTLVQAQAEGLPELRVVARGEATGFYRRMGFNPFPWEQVPQRYREECRTCPDFGDCRPIAMEWHREGTIRSS